MAYSAYKREFMMVSRNMGHSSPVDCGDADVYGTGVTIRSHGFILKTIKNIYNFILILVGKISTSKHNKLRNGYSYTRYTRLLWE